MDDVKIDDIGEMNRSFWIDLFRSFDDNAVVCDVIDDDDDVDDVDDDVIDGDHNDDEDNDRDDFVSNNNRFNDLDFESNC